MLSDVLAEQLVRLRRDAGKTRKDLANDCAVLGWPALTEHALGNLETGRRERASGERRREVSVDEWLVLAAALGVPPAVLLLPLGTSESVTLFGDVLAPTDRVLEWIALGFPPEGLPEVTTQARQVLIRTGDHARYVAGLMNPPDPEIADDGVEDDRPEVINLLRRLRDDMRASGQVPPALPPELSEVDQAESVEANAIAAERAARLRGAGDRP